MPSLPRVPAVKVLVTGANGFVGHALCAALASSGIFVPVPAVRQNEQSVAGIRAVPVGNIHSATDWSGALSGCQAVVHLAARVHVMGERHTDPLSAFRAVNTHGTLALVQQAIQAGIKRFVYISTIKVSGEGRDAAEPYREDDNPAPSDAYATSKWEAEQGLYRLALDSGMEWVVIRPPLIYGPGVKGNFATMISWLQRGIPLPLASVSSNKRSLISVDNLVDLIALCLVHPGAVDRLFLAADGQDVSTADLIRYLAEAMGMKARLFPFPISCLQYLGRCTGAGAAVDRLCQSLTVDISRTRSVLDWKPPLTLQQGLVRAVVRSVGR